MNLSLYIPRKRDLDEFEFFLIALKKIGSGGKSDGPKIIFQGSVKNGALPSQATSPCKSPSRR